MVSQDVTRWPIYDYAQLHCGYPQAIISRSFAPLEYTEYAQNLDLHIIDNLMQR